MSNKYNDEFLESRAEQYMEEGYSPKDAWTMAEEDLFYEDDDSWREYDIDEEDIDDEQK